MKSLFIFLTITLNLIAQNYQQGKIDMHGGKYDNYNSIGGYKDGGFGNTKGLSMYLDKNSTKNLKKNYNQTKK